MDCTPKPEGPCASKTLQCAQRGAGFNEAHLNYFSTSACSMRNKQEELEAFAPCQSYDTVGMSETRWEEACDWCVVMDGSRLFRRDGQGT